MTRFHCSLLSEPQTCTKLSLGDLSNTLLCGALPALKEFIFQGNSINHVHLSAMAEQWQGPHKERCIQLLTTQRWCPV
jgi:hypothetical protein